MATSNPPDVLEMVTGTWGTDADQDTTNFTIGDSSVQLKATAVQTHVRHRKFYPVEGTMAYKVRYIVRASSIVDGGLILRIKQYASNKSSVVATTTVFNGELSAANTWIDQEYSYTTNSGARWIKFELEKGAAVAYSVNIDYLSINRTAARFETYRAGAVSPGAGWVKLAYDTQLYDLGSVYDLGNTRFEAPYDGEWHFDAGAVFAAADDATAYGLALYVTPVGGAATFARRLDYNTPGAGGALEVSGSTTWQFAKGEYGEIYTYNGSGGAEALTVGQSNTWWTGHEIR